MKYEGSCACGKVAYAAEGTVSSVTWCYCVTCQRQAGAPFIPFASDFDEAAISWTQKPEVWKSSKVGERFFCKECGSVIGMRYLLGRNKMGFACGTIKKGEVPGPSAHIFLKDKPSWFTVPEDNAEKQQEGFNDESKKRFSEWKKAQGIPENEDIF